MEIKEAIEILERHNAWRRDRSEVLSLKMENPTQLGIAIDTVVEYIKTEKDYKKG